MLLPPLIEEVIQSFMLDELLDHILELDALFCVITMVMMVKAIFVRIVLN